MTGVTKTFCHSNNTMALSEHLKALLHVRVKHSIDFCHIVHMAAQKQILCYMQITSSLLVLSGPHCPARKETFHIGTVYL